MGGGSMNAACGPSAPATRAKPQARGLGDGAEAPSRVTTARPSFGTARSRVSRASTQSTASHAMPSPASRATSTSSRAPASGSLSGTGASLSASLALLNTLFPSTSASRMTLPRRPPCQ